MAVGAGLIYAVIVGAWAAVLVPVWLVRPEERIDPAEFHGRTSPSARGLVRRRRRKYPAMRRSNAREGSGRKPQPGRRREDRTLRRVGARPPAGRLPARPSRHVLARRQRAVLFSVSLTVLTAAALLGARRSLVIVAVPAMLVLLNLLR